MAKTNTPEKEKNTNSKASAATRKKTGVNRWKYARVFLIIAIIMILLGGIIVGLWLFQHALFAGNTRFTLRKVEVQSSGWWNARSKLVTQYLKLTPGKDNLFSLNLPSLRKKLKKIPNVESAKVFRSLPDTLTVSLFERIPRARLLSANSPWVIDGECVVMPKANCIDISSSLPVILGYNKDVKGGMVIPELKSALELIRLVNEYYPDIQIQGLSVSKPDQLRFFMAWKSQPKDRYIVYMPKNNLVWRLNALRSTVIGLRNSGDPRRIIDLNYSGTAVVR